MANPTSPDGWCPFATRVPTSKFWPGNQGRRAVVMHIAQGSHEAAVTWLTDAGMNPNSSAHFCIAKDGRIAQLVSVNDSAWANGLRIINGKWFTPADPPRSENPSWVDLQPGVNPNWYTISIEHEGVYQEKWTPEMYAANTRLLKWIAAQFKLTYAVHRNLIGHHEIEPVDRANCPGPNVDYERMAADANDQGLLGQVVPEVASRHIYSTTALVSLPTYNIVAHLAETDMVEAGYLDFQGRHWYISQYSYQRQIPNFFDSAATLPPVKDLTLGLALTAGYREAVTPGEDELRALGVRWLRVPLLQPYQDSKTGQNRELDWLLGRLQGLGISVLISLGPQTLNQIPPADGSGDWGDSPRSPGWGPSSGFIGKVSDLAKQTASFYKDRIGAIEIWNKPDDQGLAAEDYGALLAAAYAKIRAVSSVPVISAGIGGENFDYLRRVVQVARGSYDGVGWHLYEERVDGYPSPSFGIGEMRYSLSAARAIGGKPLWITEIGARLDYNWGMQIAPAEAVASYLTHTRTLLRELGRNTVAQAFWFTWKTPDESWSLVDNSGNRRPAWYAFQQQSLQTITR